MILTLDLARHVGWCAGYSTGGMQPFEQQDYGELSLAFSRWLSDLIAELRPRLLVPELPPASLKGHANLILNGMFWDANRIAALHQVSRRTIDPQTLKAWATDNRHASKQDMTRAARTLGYEPINHDHGDACCLHAWASVATAEEAAA